MASLHDGQDGSQEKIIPWSSAKQPPGGSRPAVLGTAPGLSTPALFFAFFDLLLDIKHLPTMTVLLLTSFVGVSCLQDMVDSVTAGQAERLEESHSPACSHLCRWPEGPMRWGWLLAANYVGEGTCPQEVSACEHPRFQWRGLGPACRFCCLCLDETV